MNPKPLTKIDLITIAIVAVCISALIWMVYKYALMPEPSTEQCWYEVKYIHVSGRELTKKVYATCEGFHHWYESDKYKIEMSIPFVDGYTVSIQGATDILSVAKIKDP